MRLTGPLLRDGIGIRRVIGLAFLLMAVAAVAYLERSLGARLDLRLLYFLIVLCGAILLPRLLALAVAGGVAVVSVGISDAEGAILIINGLTHLLMYGYAALLTNNWEQERRRLMRMSRVDVLTGLHNLRSLQEQLPTWLGHAVGNELLKEVANLLRFAVRVGDEPFRFGGDEFVLLLSDADGPGALVVASRIQDIYRSMGQTLRGTGVDVSFSIGLAVFPEDGITPEALLERADAALLEAKRAGPAKIVRYQARSAA